VISKANILFCLSAFLTNFRRDFLTSINNYCHVKPRILSVLAQKTTEIIKFHLQFSCRKEEESSNVMEILDYERSTDYRLNSPLL
jgi:hypothetical protein